MYHPGWCTCNLALLVPLVYFSPGDMYMYIHVCTVTIVTRLSILHDNAVTILVIYLDVHVYIINMVSIL